MNPKRDKYIVYTKHRLVNTWSSSAAMDDETLEEIKELFSGREIVIYERKETDGSQ